MGIRYLNMFIKKHSNTINPTTLNEIRGQTIAVDINNYLYRLKSTGDIIDEIIIFCKLMKKYDAIPIFVFDGKPPKEKKHIIKKRKENMSALKNKLAILEKIKPKDGSRVINALKELTKTVSFADILRVRKYFKDNSYNYIVSTNNEEADDICIELIRSKKVQSIISDDMDFVGACCPVVLRTFDQYNETCCFYKIELILRDLNMSQDAFMNKCQKLKKNSL